MGECYPPTCFLLERGRLGFNGHPPLWVNATYGIHAEVVPQMHQFQWAPTLVGECYFNDAIAALNALLDGFNGHPPLGVNATV